MSGKKFHHGNLRADLVALATTRIEQSGYEDLSMRELAASLGVSAGAPYRHFSNKDELLQQVAEQVNDELTEAYRAATVSDDAPLGRFRSACRAYIDLANQRPQIFRMLFLSEAYLRTPAEDGTLASYQLFVDLAEQAFPEGGRANAEMRALTAWSAIHGFSVIRLDSRAPALVRTDEAMEAVLDRACSR